MTKFVIALDGSVEDAALACTSLPDDAVVDCVVDGFKSLQFPKPQGGLVTVVYPIQFNPG